MSSGLLLSVLFSCAGSSRMPSDAPDETTPAATEDTAAQLADFYDAHGGRDAFPEHTTAMIEALLYAQDEVDRGELAAARERIDAIFASYPLSADIWVEDATRHDVNVGWPIAYYGLRMLDVVASEPAATRSGDLTMTAVVATCASVRRPTLDGGSETVALDIDARILADDARMLHQSTALFRRWVQSITGGLEVVLEVVEQTECATVDYSDDGDIIVSYPDAAAMIDLVGGELADQTDFWWVVAPSGVPGDGAGYDRHFITGGMGGYGAGLPLLLSDDAWFTRKPEHLGQGDYSDVERRVYQPQWFQHEFMHHFYRTWPEFALEVSSHQWFDRATWPDDFEGTYEPDYYAESIAKRLMDAEPSLAEGLQAPEPVFIDDIESLGGDYARQPVENEWHQVTVTVSGTDITWSNAAGVSWGLEVIDGQLYTGEDCPYGVMVLGVTLEEDVVTELNFGGEVYAQQ